MTHISAYFIKYTEYSNQNIWDTLLVSIKFTLLEMLDFRFNLENFMNVMDESITSELSFTLYQTLLCSFPERPKSYTQYIIDTFQNTQQMKDWNFNK